MGKKKTYGLGEEASLARVPAPELPYRAREPKRYRPRIGLIGCGGITEQHLKAYRKAGYEVAALCDFDPAKAEKRRAEFYPRASVHGDYREVIRRDDIEVLDIATHPAERVPILTEALKAKKHVLSQKPFVLDLDQGKKLVDLADKNGVKLAVNQNGRFSPHWGYMREAIKAGLIGEVMAVHCSVHWNHQWIKGTHFESVRHIVLYDFAIHWFDVVSMFLRGKEPKRVFASYARSPSQIVRPNLLAQALIEYEGAQASLSFDAETKFGPEDRTVVVGTNGTIKSVGPSLTEQRVTLHNAKGVAVPKLKGSWFPDGFHGAMAELLCAVEEDREPLNGAKENLKSLALCFAATESADTGLTRAPGRVKRAAT